VVPHLPEAFNEEANTVSILVVKEGWGGGGLDPISVFSKSGCIADHLIFRQMS
jgi:hypothetical protein